MSNYAYETRYNAPAHTKGRQGNKLTEIVIHHYGDDSATYDSSLGWLIRRGATTSAHYVVDAGKVACIVSPEDTAYHAGNWPVNLRSVGIENHPIWTPERERTLVELCADLHETYGNLRYSCHGDHSLTACPGRWRARLPHIITAVNAELARRAGRPPKVSPSTAAKPLTREEQSPYWIVEPGDTLTKIANYYGVPDKIAHIARHNGIADAHQIKPGQHVYIPGPLVWIVERGDTWQKIANYYGYAPEFIQAKNEGKSLTPGTILNIWG